MDTIVKKCVYQTFPYEAYNIQSGLLEMLKYQNIYKNTEYKTYEGMCCMYVEQSQNDYCSLEGTPLVKLMCSLLQLKSLTYQDTEVGAVEHVTL